MARNNAQSTSNSGTLTQKELEAPVKGYQLKEVTDELVEINKVLTRVEGNTAGVVTHMTMESYVDKRIDEKIAPLVLFKNNTSRLSWTILVLIITDIGARILQGIR